MPMKALTYIAYPKSADNRYNVWVKMKDRCLNAKSDSYEDYGGRGISVCKRWQSSFEAFAADMGYRPSEKYSIERLDNDGDYSPTNCVWADKTSQQLNKRTTTYLWVDGEKIKLPDAAARFGVSMQTVQKRRRAGWSDKQSLGIDSRPSRGCDDRLKYSHKSSSALFIDRTGEQFGCYVLKAVAEKSTPTHTYWIAECSCGDSRVVRTDRLRRLSDRACSSLPASPANL